MKDTWESQEKLAYCLRKWLKIPSTLTTRMIKMKFVLQVEEEDDDH